MKIQVYLEREHKKINLEASSIKDITKKLNLNLNEIIIIKNNELITEKTKLKNNDEIKILPVVSGG